MLEIVATMGKIANLLQFLGKDRWAELYKQAQRHIKSKQTNAPIIQEVRDGYDTHDNG